MAKLKQFPKIKFPPLFGRGESVKTNQAATAAAVQTYSLFQRPMLIEM